MRQSNARQQPAADATTKHTEELVWNNQLRVGHPKIDAMHFEFVELANALLHCAEASAKKCLGEIETHLQAHFESEKALMDRTNYPAADCHLDEHHKVLETVTRVRLLQNQDNVSLNDIHRLAKALIDWFPGHIFYMDSALSTWISKQEHQGSPLIFHRKNNIGATSEAQEFISRSA